jgi:hypothetical protein
LEARANGFVSSDDFHCCIGSALIGPIEDSVYGVLGPSVDGVCCAEGFGELEFFVFEIDGDDFGEACNFEGLDAKQSDHTCADDDDRPADGSRSSVGGVDGDGDGFDHRRVFEG